MRARLLLPVATACLAGACSLVPDRSLDYTQARDLPPLTLPEGKTTRPIQPLYVIPTVSLAGNAPVLVEQKGRKAKFVIPAPAPLVESEAAPVASVATTGESRLRPRLVSDGNGYPLVQVDGDADHIWDQLNQALKAGKIQVEDRNQSLGIYYIRVPADGKPTDLQLKVTRSAGSSVLFLQRDEDTVADTDTARALFARLLESWPASAAASAETPS